MEEELLGKIKNFRQDNIFEDLNNLTNEQIEEISTDLKKINFNVVRNILDTNLNKEINLKIDKEKDMKIEPINSQRVAYSNSVDKIKLWNLAIEHISHGRIGVILLAGGQGTRLKVAYPKGMCDVKLPSQKSIYQIQAERILKLQQFATDLYPKNVNRIFWYIMTSESTINETIKFFQENNYFGLNKKQVVFFKQSMLPCFALEQRVTSYSKNPESLFISGRWLLRSSASHISIAPDGNGGVYSALLNEKILDHMTKNNVYAVHVYSVDNILVKVADPIFIGYCLDKNADCAAKAVEKMFPDEAVGIICSVNDHPSVIEYSELPDELAKFRHSENNKLVYNAGNICNHYFTFNFLRKIVNNHLDDLKFHFAIKSMDYYDIKSNKQMKQNVLKLEKFVFDVFPFSENFHLLMVDRLEEFSPLKNADKKDSPETCKTDLLNLHKKWLNSNNFSWSDLHIKILEKTNLFWFSYNDITKEKYCEISPLISYSGEGLKEYLKSWLP